MQGVAKGVGLIKEVSWQQAVGAGIGAGLLASPLGTELSTTLKSLLEAKVLDPKVLGNAILQSGKIAVATELLSMAAGTKKAFDFENVLATMGSTLSNIGIAKATSSEIVRTTLNSLSNTALDSVAHNNYQLESMAANLLGSAVQYGAQKGMEAFSSSYYEAAQRGETVKPNNASRLNGTNAGNRVPHNQSARQLPHQTSRAPTAAYFSDPLLDADFTEILDPRINVNNPSNAQRLGNGVANINSQTYLQSQSHAAAAQPTQHRVSTTSRVLNALNAAGNSQFIADFNQTVEALRDAPGNELLGVYHDVRGGNIVGGLARGALDVMSVLPAGRVARGIELAGAALEGVAARAGRFGFFEKPAQVIETVYHATTINKNPQGVLNGIDPLRLGVDNRFGKGFYVARDPNTSIAELVHHNSEITHGIRFDFNTSQAKILDLTNPKIAREYGYLGGGISRSTQQIGLVAKEQGYNVIKFNSLRGPNINYAVLNDFNSVLTPQIITPIPPLEVSEALNFIKELR